MGHVLRDRSTQGRLPDEDHPIQHSSLIEQTKRSAYAFRFGDIGGSRITSVPDSRTIYEIAVCNVIGIPVDDQVPLLP